MTAPPTFTSLEEYGSRLGDVGFWRTYVAEALERHDLADAGGEPEAGFVGTFPTFLYGDVAVKLFGYFPSWRRSHAAERAAQVLVSTDPAIAAPRLLGEGHLFDDFVAPWPYLITTRVPGVAWRDAGLSTEQRLSVAAELGGQVRRVRALRPSGNVPHVDRHAPNAAVAAERHRAWGSLPPHLIAQIDDYLARLGPFDSVFVHADLTEDHVFVEGGRLTGIIDWGDAIVTDRHYELAALCADVFRCDKAVLGVFLEAYDWPGWTGKDFPHQALGLALQHEFDVFEPVGAVLPLRDIATLDDLAKELYAF